jgi:hypothetical protein
MAEPIVPLERAMITGEGFINDLIANIIETCELAFTHDEQLKPHAPQKYYGASPRKKVLENTPSLHVWCPKTLPVTPAMGGGTGDPLTTHFQHFISIEYVYFDADKDESDRVVNQVACALFDVINQHQNVNGLTNGMGGVFQILTSDGFYATGPNSVKLLNNCTINAVYHRSYKRPTATR